MSAVLCSMVGASFTVAAVATVAKAVTATGTAQVSTAQSKFGGSSLLISSQGSLEITNSQLTTTGDYTIELFFRMTSFVANSVLFNLNVGPTDLAGRTVAYFPDTSGQIFIDTFATGTPDFTSGGNSAITGATLNTFHHFAYCRSAGTVRVFLDGVLKGTATSNVNFPTTGITIGLNANGHFDEIRFSHSARYTSAFSPPTAAFVRDATTALLIHCDGANGSLVFTDDSGTIAAKPEFAGFTAATGETQANGILDGQLAIMGKNSDGTIRAAYTGNSTSSTQGFIKPILFNTGTNAITFGTRVNCMAYTSSVIFGLKTVSEVEYDLGTADATNFGVTYMPNNNSPGPLVSVYPFSMTSAGAVTVGTHATLSLTNVGTADRASDIAFDGLYGGVPRYTLFSRYDAGSANQYVISRSSNTLSITRAFNSAFGTGNRTTAASSFAGVGEASSLFGNGFAQIAATTFGSTSRTSSIIDTGIGSNSITNLVMLSSGTTAKYMLYGYNSTATLNTSRIANVTYSASVAPTVTMGASFYNESTAFREITQCRLVKGFIANEAFLFFIQSNKLYVKKATVSGDVITWGSDKVIMAMTASTFDIMPANLDANNKVFIGAAFNAGAVTAFAVVMA